VSTARQRDSVIDAVIDTTCAAADSQASKVNDDCWVSKL
jgi:hypothetical protein